MVQNLAKLEREEKRRSDIYDEWRKLLDFALLHPDLSMDEAYLKFKKERND